MELYLPSQSVFSNTDNLFIEFNDVINSYIFTMLISYSRQDEEDEFFELYQISGKPTVELYDWYLARNNQNALKDLGPSRKFNYEKARTDKTMKSSEKEIFEIFADDFLNAAIAENEKVIDERSNTEFAWKAHEMFKLDIIKNKYVYTPVYSKYVEKLLSEMYEDNIKYVYGPLTDVIENEAISNNSTFIFSDIYKILALADSCILHNASVSVANYKYNLNENGEPKLDIDTLIKENGMFRLSFFNPLF